MESRLTHPRQIQAQLQVLGDEIQSICKEYDGHITGLGQRLREAEDRQRKLQHQLDAAMNQSVGPPSDSHSGYSSSYINSDSPVPRSGARTRTSRNITSPQEFTSGMVGSGIHGSGYSPLTTTNSDGYKGSPSRLPPSQLANLDATPRPNIANRHSYPDDLQPKREQHAPIGTKDNAAYLPMIIENIMAERHRHERDGTLRSCGFVLEKGWGNGVKCSQNSFHMPCFRAHHFYYCRQHMRVIPSAKTVCSHRNKENCLVVVFEDHEDWDAIVDAALAAGNLGNKGLDAEEFKEALFPPQNYPHRYMGA